MSLLDILAKALIVCLLIGFLVCWALYYNRTPQPGEPLTKAQLRRLKRDGWTDDEIQYYYRKRGASQ